MISVLSRKPLASGSSVTEEEIDKAFNVLIDSLLIYQSQQSEQALKIQERMKSFYQLSCKRYVEGNFLAAERWAKASRHLSLAYFHEAKISYLKGIDSSLQALFIDPQTYTPRHSNQPEDMISSVTYLFKKGEVTITKDMNDILECAISRLKEATTSTSLAFPHLSNEQHNAAYEYARSLECMVLALEAESNAQRVA